MLTNHLYNERYRLALWLPVLFAIGIGIYFSLPSEPNVYWPFITSLLCTIPLAFFWSNFYLRIVFIALLMINLGILRADIRTESVAAPILQEEIFSRITEGTINDIQNKEKSDKIILTNVHVEGLEPENTPKKISVSLKQGAGGLSVGDRIQLQATLFPPPSPVMPQAYDFARMFYYEQLGAVGYSAKPAIIVEQAPMDSFEKKLNSLRLSISSRILTHMSEENGWIAAAMMVGEQSGVSKEAAEALRQSGIYHVLSISGLHMSLAVMLVFVSVRLLLTLYPPFALRFPIKKIAAFIGLCSSFAYLLLAGYPVPAVRSFIMVACVMLAIIFDRSGISIFSLAWAALLTLLWQPESLLGASFQLSFAATLAILAFYERFSHLLYKSDTGFAHKIFLYFLGIMLTSLIATLATTPLVIYHFNRFTLWGIAANILMLPLASFWIMPAAVVAFLLMPFGLEHYPLIALDYGITIMMRGARLFAALPYSQIALPSPSFLGLMLIVAGGLWLCIWQKKWRLTGTPLIIIGMATIAMHKPYDLLISSDASKVAIRQSDGKFLFLRGKDDSFDGQAWLRANGQEESAGTATCEKNKCVVSAYGKKIVVTRGKKGTEKSCDDNPDIVISQNYLADIATCTQAPLLVDKDYLDKNGATALRFTGEVAEIETSKQFRGNRAWVK